MTSTKLAPRGMRRGIPDVVRQSLISTAAWTGAMAAAISATVAICIAVACWLPDAGVSGNPIRAIRGGVLAFLAAHHGGVTIDGVPIDFVPIGATAVVVAVLWRAGTVLAEMAGQVGENRGSRLGTAVIVQAVTYGACCVALSVVGAVGTSSTSALRVAIATTALAMVVAGTSLCCSARYHRWWRVRLPHFVGLGGRAAAAACLLLICSGAVLLAGSLVVHAERVMRLSSLVGGGLAGASVAVLGVLSAPNGAVFAASYIAGPGFAVGHGTTFTALSSGRGTVPAFPLLGALPSGNGASRLVLGWIAVTLIGVVFVVTRVLAPTRPMEGLRALLGAAGLAGAGMAGLCWLAGGALGTDRLRAIGPSPLRVAGSVALEVLVPALVLLTAIWLGRWLRSFIRRRRVREVPVERTLTAVGAPDD